MERERDNQMALKCHKQYERWGERNEGLLTLKVNLHLNAHEKKREGKKNKDNKTCKDKTILWHSKKTFNISLHRRKGGGKKKTD